MSSLIDRIKGALQGASHKQKHDHDPGGAHGHIDKQEQATPEAPEHEHASGHEHDEEGHKHC